MKKIVLFLMFIIIGFIVFLVTTKIYNNNLESIAELEDEDSCDVYELLKSFDVEGNLEQIEKDFEISVAEESIS